MYDDLDYYSDEREMYENDLEDLMDCEAFEDAAAERESDYYFDAPAEDEYLDSAYEDRTDLDHMEDFGEY